MIALLNFLFLHCWKPLSMLGWLSSECKELKEELLSLDERSGELDGNERKKIVSELGDVLFDALMLEMVCRRDLNLNVSEAWEVACEKIERRTPYMSEWGKEGCVAKTAEEATKLWMSEKSKENVENKDDVTCLRKIEKKKYQKLVFLKQWKFIIGFLTGILSHALFFR